MALSDNISSVITAIGNAIKGKQNTLVSGTNIKTINSQSILGSGDIVISGGGTNGSVQFNNNGTQDGATHVDIDGGDLMLNVNATPTTPAVGNVKLFAKQYGNTRVIPAAMGPSGMDYALQPAIWRQKVGLWSPPGGSATLPAVWGFPAFTAVGKATARNVATTNLMTRMRRLGYVSGATAGALTSLYQTTAQWTTGTGTGLGGFYFEASFNFSDAEEVNGARAFIGLSSSVAAPTNVEPSTLTNSVGLAQLSTDNTQLYIVYGGSAAQTPIALGTEFPPFNGTVGITTGVPYRFSLWSPPSENGQVNWQLERLDTGTKTSGTLGGVAGTSTPANTTLMAIRAWRTNNAPALIGALAVGVDYTSFYIETDY